MSLDSLEIMMFGRKLTEDLYREALRCEKCRLSSYDHPQGQRPCSYDQCVEVFCVGCGYSNGGWGPVGCKCQLVKWWQSADQRRVERLMRIRQRRAARRRNDK